MFRFKQFTIQQDQCAMKVCTDSCLFGAWMVAHPLLAEEAWRCLDIGTGTGLLSLMLAQAKPQWLFNAIELDEAAAGQAADNVASSPFATQIRVIQGDVLRYEPTHFYDFIFSNPPFYEAQLTSPVPEKNIAHHSLSLSLEALLAKSFSLLGSSGWLALLLPFYRKNELLAKLSSAGFCTHSICLVKQHPGKDFFRVMVLAQKGVEPVEEPTESTIVIQTSTGDYSPLFTELLRPYYLKL